MATSAPGSWVVTKGERRYEVAKMRPGEVRLAKAAGWKVQPIAEYLAELNARIRAGGTA